MKNVPFFLIVGVVIFIITFQLSMKGVTLLNSNTDTSFLAGLGILSMCCMAWVIYFAEIFRRIGK